MDPLAILSALFGWVYTLCWSLSFYPQPLLNRRRRSTAGTTVDFPLINCLGFLAYLLSTAALRYAPAVRAQYAARHHGLTPTVAANDVAFAAHALVLSLVTLSQYLLPGAWGWAAAAAGRDGEGEAAAAASAPRSNRPSRFILGLMAACVAGVGAVALLAAAAASPSSGPSAPSGPSGPSDATAWAALDVVYALGYVKLVVTLVKYSPQVLANWRNRSTAGWSILQILLDWAGGLLSIVQLLLDSYRQRDWSGLTGNPVKLALGNVSMAYDLVFFVQHYVLYPAAGGARDGRRKSAAAAAAEEDGAAAAPPLARGTEREPLL